MDFSTIPSPYHQTSLANGRSLPGLQRHTEEKELPGGWCVLKFGGTSVGKFPEGIAKIVETGLKKNRTAIVCSARSNSTKSEGTTNRLLRCARAAEVGRHEDFYQIIEAIRDDHAQAARSTIASDTIAQAYIEDLNRECDSLRKILESAEHLEEVSLKAEDKIISKGEKLSCRFMAAVLQDCGVDAQYVDLSDVIKFHVPGGVLTEKFYKDLANALAEEVLACADKVPVITGYFGQVPGGLLGSIGRGYTDLCAALVAIGLAAEELQIWKEVDGIFTADPRKVPTARLLSSVTPAEAAELTFYGSEVIHPFTMEQVIRERIPIRVKNVMNPRNPGTVIMADMMNPSGGIHDARLFRTRSSSSVLTQGNGFRPKRPTAVTIKRNVVVLNVHSNKKTRAHGFLMNIFRILDRWHLSVDLISSSEVHVSMALHSEAGLLSQSANTSNPVLSTNGNASGRATPDEEYRIKDEDLRGAVAELSQFATIDIVPNLAIVSLVGRQLKHMVGISGKFFSVLGENNINIEMISQGASEINISCVIEERDADRALNVVHTNLFTFLE